MPKKRDTVKYATYRAVVLQLKRERQQLNQALLERNILAKLASGEPRFFNPLEAIEARMLRDRILGAKGPGGESCSATKT